MKGGITEATIEEIKARTDLEDLISSYGVQVVRRGASCKACCPFHHEKTPSFNINSAKGFYHCFGCNESGDAIKFVQKMEGLTFVEAVRKLADQLNIKIEEQEDPEAGRRKRLYALMAELAEFYHRCLGKIKEAERARKYLAERELDEAVQKAFTIGYAPKGIANIRKWAEIHKYKLEELEAAGVIKAPTGPGDEGYHRFGGRLMFTIRDRQGRVVAFSGRQLEPQKNSGKYVNSPETLIFRKSKVLFGFDRAAAKIAASPHREAIVCEGQIDTIRLHLNGFPVAVASQGTAFTEEHVKMVRRVADSVLLVFDDDAAGHKATIRTARLFLAAEMPVRVVRLPGGEDPDSYLRKFGPEPFQQLIDAAESVIAFQVQVERLKERNPESIDAVARISKALLETVAMCPSAVLKANMLGEAAKLTGIPVSALREELGKVKVPNPTGMRLADTTEQEEDVYPTEPVELETEGEPSPETDEGHGGAETPPNEREFALLAFLMAQTEADPQQQQAIGTMLGDFLGGEILPSEFARRYVETWRAGVASGEFDFNDFAAGMSLAECRWFDRIIQEGSKTGVSTMKPTDIMQDFVRSLWMDRLTAERGRLPALGGEEADMKRMKLTMDLRRLKSARWNVVKDLIRDLNKE